jgi:hypothetical protein
MRISQVLGNGTILREVAMCCDISVAYIPRGFLYEPPAYIFRVKVKLSPHQAVETYRVVRC